MRVHIDDQGEVRRVTVYGPVQVMGRVVPYAQFESRYSRSLLEAFVAQRGQHFLNEYERFTNPLYVRGRLQRCLARIGCGPANTRSTLDFGCGTGTVSLILAEMGFAHVTGIDINDQSIALARRRAAEQGLPEDIVTFRTVAPGDPSLGDGAYDLVILNAVLEHLTPEERRHLLPTLWRALSPGGHLLIHETPNRLFPIDRHTTGLIGLPWLPVGLKRLYARLCRRPLADLGPTGFFRTGIHGATIFEIRSALPPGEVEDLSEIQDPYQTELTATGRARPSAERLLISLLRAGLRLLKPVLARFGFATVHLYPFLLVCLRKRRQPVLGLSDSQSPLEAVASVAGSGYADFTSECSTESPPCDHSPGPWRRAGEHAAHGGAWRDTEATHREQESDVACLGRLRPAGPLVISPASTSDIEWLISLDVTGRSVPTHRVRNRFLHEKMRAYLASSHAFILTARHNFQIAGYVAVVINPGFAIETRRLFRLARQLFIAIRGGYGWNIRYWLRIARKIYVRLWKDPSLRTRQRVASSKEPTAWVNGIVVDEQWRGRGVAGQLLQAAHAKLMEMNVGIVGADTPADNAASLRAFAKAGYRPSSWVRLQAGAATQIVIKCLQK